MEIDTLAVPRTTLSNLSATETVTSDFQTFLKMLTAQLQNQDPLNPLDSSDFAVQLATFSGVEQQVRTNDLLANLTASFGLADLSKAAGLIGGEVRSTAPPIFTGQQIDLYFDVPRSAFGAEMVVRNALGYEMSRQAVQPGTSGGVWSGLNSAGDPLPAGAYSFAIEIPKTNGGVDTINVHSYSRVIEAETQDGRVKLVLEGGMSVDFSEISGVRAGY
jgi:flagellar basal-body rod modification protein FlgD